MILCFSMTATIYFTIVKHDHTYVQLGLITFRVSFIQYNVINILSCIIERNSFIYNVTRFQVVWLVSTDTPLQ